MSSPDWNCKPGLCLFFGFFDHGLLTHDNHNSALAHVESLRVRLCVIPNLCVLGKIYMPINDRVADARVAANTHMVVDDRIVNFAKTVDADIEANDRANHSPAGYNATTADDGVQRRAHTIGIVEHEFRRRILLLPGA